MALLASVSERAYKRPNVALKEQHRASVRLAPSSRRLPVPRGAAQTGLHGCPIRIRLCDGGKEDQVLLDELSELVKALAKRILEHRSTLTRSEAATRYGLIDPLLMALGWDLSDPSQVWPEYPTDDRTFADYAMLHQSEPYLIIEAKKLGDPLSADTRKQAADYLLSTPARYAVVTNGQRWKGYSMAADGVPTPAPVKDKVAFEFNVLEPSSMLDLLWLWRGNMMGSTVQPKSHQPPLASPVPNSSGLPITRPSSAQSGTPLPDVNYAKGMGKPQCLLFPDGTATEAVSKSWATVQSATAEWLFVNGKVGILPLKNKHGTHLANSTPTTAKGKNFHVPKEVRPHFWIDMNFGPDGHLTKAKEMLAACGVSPASVKLQLS